MVKIKKFYSTFNQALLFPLLKMVIYNWTFPDTQNSAEQTREFVNMYASLLIFKGGSVLTLSLTKREDYLKKCINADDDIY